MNGEDRTPDTKPRGASEAKEAAPEPPKKPARRRKLLGKSREGAWYAFMDVEFQKKPGI